MGQDDGGAVTYLSIYSMVCDFTIHSYHMCNDMGGCNSVEKKQELWNVVIWSGTIFDI